MFSVLITLIRSTVIGREHDVFSLDWLLNCYLGHRLKLLEFYPLEYGDGFGI